MSRKKGLTLVCAICTLIVANIITLVSDTSIIVHQVQPGWFGIDAVKLATERMSENQNSY